MKWATYPKTPMNKVHQIRIQIQTKERKKKIENRKEKKKGRRTRSPGLAAQLLGPPAQPR